jgi:subtilase family serine protease
MKGKAFFSLALGCGILILSALPAGATITPKPDLIISSILAEKVETTLVPLRLKVTVVTKNQGAAYAQHFNCRLYYRLTSSAPWQELETWHRDGLNLSQTFSHVTQRDFTAGGTYYFKAQADCDLELAESNEGNNIRYYSKSLTAGTPDLVVSNLAASITSVSTSGTWSVKVEWDIENTGDGKAVGSFVSVLKASTNGAAFNEVQRYTLYILDKGLKHHYTRTATYSGIQSLRFQVKADDMNTIHERNETNNISTSATLTH